MIDKNSLFAGWIMQKCELCIGFSHSPTLLKRPLTQTISIWITKAGFVVKINFDA